MMSHSCPSFSHLLGGVHPSATIGIVLHGGGHLPISFEQDFRIILEYSPMSVFMYKFALALAGGLLGQHFERGQQPPKP